MKTFNIHSVSNINGAPLYRYNDIQDTVLALQDLTAELIRQRHERQIALGSHSRECLIKGDPIKSKAGQEQTQGLQP